MRTDDDNKKKELDPVIEKVKNEFKEKIDRLKDDRKKQQTEYNKALDDYYDQQNLIRHVEWLKRIKSKLEREEKFK